MILSNPDCCGKRMDFISQTSTNKFYEISNYRCSVCGSEMQTRDAGSKELLEALMHEAKEKSEAFD